MSLKIMVSPAARRQLEKLHDAQRQRIVEALRQLATDPFKSRPKADIKKLIGLKDKIDLYRLRVGNYRIIFEVSQNAIWVSEIVTRGSAYKFLF